MRRLRVVNLFAGHQTWVKPFREAGHKTWTTDIVPFDGIDLVSDILDLKTHDLPWGPGEVDVLVASPDCSAFSVASIGTHWTGGIDAYIPATDKARNRMQLVRKTVKIIEYLQPTVFVVENPRGVLRKLGLLDMYDRHTVWYCHYGEGDRAKPTDLWGGFPTPLKLRPMCHNQRFNHSTDCCCRDHESAPRGAKTGTQGRKREARSFIPYQLARAVRNASERQILGT